MQTIEYPFNAAFRKGVIQTDNEPFHFQGLRINQRKNNIVELHVQEIAGISEIAIRAISKSQRKTSFQYNENFQKLEKSFPQIAHKLAETFELAIRKSDINPRLFRRQSIWIS